ncbi:hypothetical protein G6F46_004704 [Rhizopus delemar]|uniref:Actin-like ATPase domain-containing protein n=1 Tax=Rhizopus oryzae TaxID=64495 RepID=A0A9P6YQ19_RHIOR|nr:hypothetical protein G6F43_008937 [Rhizopus delemar]KAG1553859.1 hypothetical protein G6F51_000330 [Rhizopus arrhizus]KAG1452345.1 hypothetical protein G6F55_008729 [Rhizopus delemar]KAG1492484.1 hypothetical protein G6F54_009281 [Rhizopus delemar]KAG1506692.1 hypothetical protein G6F53_009504 [Rhizopus delemar]
MSNPIEDYPLVIGIDFGTTYSGVSYAYVNDSEIVDITKWPRQPDYSYPKCPTVCQYSSDDGNLIQWGRFAKSAKADQGKVIVIQQFKIYLDENPKRPLAPLPLDLTVSHIISDYLQKMFTYIKTYMCQKGFSRDFDQKARYCLTVPAMWSDQAKQTMREAAIQSGLIQKSDHRDRLMLISEPEAAALYCERTCDKFDMKDGEEFMICDAGGGTVDLIVFKVERGLDGKNIFRESTRGLGETCGSMFIDMNFRKLLRKRLKKILRPSPNGKVIIPEGPFEHMMDVFVDSSKPLFDNTDDIYCSIPMGFDLRVKTDPSLGLDEGTITFTKEEIKRDVFDPVIQRIIQLCRQLQKDTVDLKAIFTVGGFGSSAYLYQQLEKEFSAENIKIIQPDRPEMAVARGAVIFGMNPNKIATRVPRLWYGIKSTYPFDPQFDPEEYKVIRPGGLVRCDNRFSTFVERGKPLDLNSCIIRQFTIYAPYKTACSIFSSASEHEPRYTEGDGVKKVFDCDIPMPELPHIRPGDPISLTIKMYFGELEHRVEAVINDVTYNVSCRFDVE